MIHHLSIAARNPQQVAQVLAELFQGEAVPFPDARYPDSYVAVSFDDYGTVVDVHPFSIELIPGSENDALFQCRQNPDASSYTATHAAISVPVSEEQIETIAAREHWQTRHRKGLFEVIELWVENRVLIELLPPAIASGYLAFMEPQRLKQFFAAKAASTESTHTLQSIRKKEFMMKTQFEDVLQFWFSPLTEKDQTALAHQWQRWFRGGGDAEIIQRFSHLLNRAVQGELDDWSAEPRSRLALIIVLDQFSRTVYRGTAQAFAQDPKACALALEGLEMGHYEALESPWEKTFFFLPLGHSEDLKNLEQVTKLADDLVQAVPQDDRSWLAFSAEQAHRHRNVVAQFGRHPHRNEVLGRLSTPSELEYLAIGQLVHTRSLPPHLSQFLSKS